MRIRLHDDVAGHKSGETVDVENDYAKWLVANGYASTSKDADGVRATSVPADQDPTLAENREEPDPTLREQMAKGLGTPGSAEPDESEIVPKPYVPGARDQHEAEVFNADGDPEAAEKGKDKLEEAAVKTQVDEEKEAAKREAHREANDKREAEIQEQNVKADDDPHAVTEEELEARRELEAPRALGDATPLEAPRGVEKD